MEEEAKREREFAPGKKTGILISLFKNNIMERQNPNSGRLEEINS